MSVTTLNKRFTLLFFVALSFFGCNSIFYQPDRMVYSAPDEPKIEYEDISIEGGDGNTIHARFFPAQGGLARGGAKGTVVQFHGNAQNLTAHYRFLYWLSQHGYHLLTFDYRGYGKSTGVAKRRGVRSDAVSLLRFVEENPQAIDFGGGVVLYGHSLGSIVLLEALLEAGSLQVEGIILEASFDSYRGVAVSVLKRSWLTWPLIPPAVILVNDSGSPKRRLDSIAPGIPKLVLHTRQDQVIALDFGLRVYQKIAGPKELEIYEMGGHNNLYGANDPRAAEVTLHFLRRAIESQSPSRP